MVLLLGDVVSVLGAVRRRGESPQAAKAKVVLGHPAVPWAILLRGAAGLVGKSAAVDGRFLWALDAEQTDLWVLASTVTPNCPLDFPCLSFPLCSLCPVGV